jgi:hypothetical protein
MLGPGETAVPREPHGTGQIIVAIENQHPFANLRPEFAAQIIPIDPAAIRGPIELVNAVANPSEPPTDTPPHDPASVSSV